VKRWGGMLGGDIGEGGWRCVEVDTVKTLKELDGGSVRCIGWSKWLVLILCVQKMALVVQN
jgi:hypothetical protein